MTNKEALERIKRSHYVAMSMLCDGRTDEETENAIEVIEKALDRLEELEEELRVAREHSNNMDWYNDNQYKLLNKYEKVIDILRRKSINMLILIACENWTTYNSLIDDTILFSPLTEEEFKACKKVFGDE